MKTLDVVITNSSSQRMDIKCGELDIFYEVSGLDDFELPQPDFVMWAVLPLAMRQNARLRLHFPVDPVALANARELVRTWTMWLPEVYWPIEIVPDEERVPEPSRFERGITLFSGGVDSTFALLRQLEEGGPPPVAHVVTVHGMNYTFDHSADLDELFEKTKVLLDRHNLQQVVVRTNIAVHLKRLGLTHGFLLSSSLFFLSRAFSRGYIAADTVPMQDFLTFPWGSNHITNKLFAGTHFRMDTLSLDTMRIWKLDYLRKDPVALDAISFCLNKRLRPANCGVCTKCVRTKVMFTALAGDSPDIFLSNELTPKMIRKLDSWNNGPFKHEILEVGRLRGTLDKLPGLEAHIMKDIRRRTRVYKLKHAWKAVKHTASKYI